MADSHAAPDPAVDRARLEGRCIVAVHAHPDDESTKGAATIARYAAAGVRCVLVCCTDGRGGRQPSSLGLSLVEVRAGELDRAAAILGYRALHRLGHHDSGIDAADPDGFAHVPLEDVAAEILQILTDERPDVVVTYDPHYAAGHPDHLHARRATVAAFTTYQQTHDRPVALYGTRTHPPTKLRAMHHWLTQHGEPSPYADALDAPDTTTTRIHVGDHLDNAHRALRQHASQADPDDQWFFAVPTTELRVVFPFEDFTRLAPDPRHDIGVHEHDLFGHVTSS